MEHTALCSQPARDSATGAYLESWMALQCRILTSVRRGALLLGDADRGPFTTVAVWAEGQWPTKELLDAAEAALQKRDDIIRAAGPGEDASRREGTYVAHPIVFRGILHGAAVVELAGPSHAKPHTALRQLRWGSGWLDALLQREQVATERATRRRFESVLHLLASALEQERFHGAATAFATELATLLECDRVGVGFMHRGRVQLRAFSHSASFSKKASLVRAIEAAMEEALDQEATVVFPSPEELLRGTHPRAELSRRYGSGSICSVPLLHGETPCGVLTLERSADEPFDHETVGLCEAIAALAGPALEIQRRDDRWLAAKVAESFKTQLAHLLGPHHMVLKLAKMQCYLRSQQRVS